MKNTTKVVVKAVQMVYGEKGHTVVKSGRHEISVPRKLRDNKNVDSLMSLVRRRLKMSTDAGWELKVTFKK